MKANADNMQVSMQGFQKEKWRIENNGHSAEVERVEKNHEMVGFSFFCGFFCGFQSTSDLCK